MEKILLIAAPFFLYGLLWGLFYFHGYCQKKAEVLMCPDRHSPRTVAFYKNLSRTKAVILTFFIASFVGILLLVVGTLIPVLFGFITG